MKISSLLLSCLFLVLSSNNSGHAGCTETVEGYLQLFGTDHFPRIAVVTEDHGRLYLDLSADKQKALWRDRKNVIRITGKIYIDRRRGNIHTFITPKKWEWVE